MKKKLLVIFICLFLIFTPLTLTGCNYQAIDTNYTFTRAYIKIDDEWVDLEIKSWRDYEGEQLQIKLYDDTVILVSNYNCILYNGTLPRK